MLLRDLGRDHLEDLAAQQPQLARTVLCGLGDQVRLGLGQHLGRQIFGGELVQGVRDHTGLCHVDLAGRQRGGDLSHRWSSESASPRSRWLAPRSLRVWWVSHVPMSRAPSSSATSSATAITRSRNAAICDSTLARRSRATLLSSGA